MIRDCLSSLVHCIWMRTWLQSIYFTIDDPCTKGISENHGVRSSYILLPGQLCHLRRKKISKNTTTHFMSLLLRFRIVPYVVLRQRCIEQECRTDSGMFVVLIQKLLVPIIGECRQGMMTGMLQTIGLIIARQKKRIHSIMKSQHEIHYIIIGGL